MASVRRSTPVPPDDHSERVPPDPMPNSAVKPLSADGSVGPPHARVGHRQAFIPETPVGPGQRGFFRGRVVLCPTRSGREAYPHARLSSTICAQLPFSRLDAFSASSCRQSAKYIDARHSDRSRSGATQNLCDHFAPRRRQDHHHGKNAAVRQCDPASRVDQEQAWSSPVYVKRS